MNLNEIDDFEDGLEKDLLDPALNEDPIKVDNNDIEDPVEDPEDGDINDSPDDSGDVVSLLLKNKGINPNSIKFENEEGEIEERSFNDLSPEEQLQILNYSDDFETHDLDNDEVQFINSLRSNNMSIAEYNQYIANKAIQDYVNSLSNNSNYEVDDIEDDELYLIDLKSRIPELSDEEAIAELESAKSNSDLFNRKVQSIREEYKQKEDLLLEQQQREQEEYQARQAQEFEDIIVNTIQDNDIIDLGDSSLALSDDDKNEIASFILDSDMAGTRYIAKALNDPKTLVKMVWYALKGEEAFGQISNYYKSKISEAAKYNYNKGYEDGRGGKPLQTNKAVVKKAATRKTKPLTINDID